MKNGVYYSPQRNKLILLTNVKNYYEDLNSGFSIVSWQGSIDTVFNKVLIGKKAGRKLIYVGRFK